MANYKLLSSDSHVIEPPDLWEKRIDPMFKDRAPKLIHEEDSDQWYADGDIRFGAIAVAGQAGQRFEDPSKLTTKGRYEDLPAAGHDPHAHVRDMDVDGVSAGVMYPSQGNTVWGLPSNDLLSAIFRAYNDWLSDFCNPYPDRLRGMAMINVDDIVDAKSEMERASRLGLVGAIFPTQPLDHRYDHPIYEPLWQTAQDLEMPLSLHVGGVRSKVVLTAQEVENLNGDSVLFANDDMPMRVSLAALVLSGVFERYPQLMVGAVEFELSWAPYFMRRLDDTYKDRVAGQVGHRYKDKDRLPSDFMRSNVYYSFQEDELGIELRHYMGVDNLMWGSDYPHGESTFPHSREVVDNILQGVPHDEKVKVAGKNTARLFRLPY